MATLEREIELAILSLKRWADLDNRMRDLIGSSHEYDKRILRYSIENQLRYRGNLVRFVVNDEYEYYRELLRYSRDHLMLFPYHLSDFIITGMRITPFQYYLSTMAQIIEQEKSYDTLPNFTAADCLRLLGIGRNQYIDIMNELRSTYRRFLGIGFKKNARSLLPSKPDKNVAIEPWWFVNAGYITEDDVRSMVSPSERSIIDRLVSPDGLSNQILACDLDEEHVRSLYLKGLIYLDVPIYDDDYIVVPPLEGFVMNRVTGDYFETLLYKIFVSIDQNTPVQELANILEIDIKLVKNAVSMYCRLNFAHKKNLYIDIDKCHPSWRVKLENYRKMGINVSHIINKSSRNISDFINELATVGDNDEGTEVLDNFVTTSESTYNFQADGKSSQLVQSPSVILSSPHSSTGQTTTNKKIVFFYDSNLAAFLMMGNLSTKLKNHAVTMFEVGKLSDEWIDSLLAELSKIQSDAIEDDGYEARRYYIHALMLHRTIQFIRTDLGVASDLLQSNELDVSEENQRVGLDLIRVESLSNLDSVSCERFLKKNYQLIISLAPLTQDVKLNTTTSLPHLGPGSPLINSLWFRLFIYHATGCGPPSLLLVQGYRLTKLPDVFKSYDTLLINHWNREPTCIHTRSALNAINEALTHSPILLQAYPMQPTGGNLVSSEEKVFVPLPLVTHAENCSLSSCSLQEPDKSDPFIDLENVPAIVELGKCLNLTKICGYITLLRSAESVRKYIERNEANNIFGARRKSESPANLTTLIDCETKEEREGDTDGQTPTNEPKLKPVTEDASNNNKDLTLFECHFGIPLFDRFLNKQVRTRISSQNLCDPNSLSELVNSTIELNDKIEKFVESNRYNKQMQTIDTSNAGDQRHFFAFPDTEQFRCPIPRPAQNLIFNDRKLGIFED